MTATMSRDERPPLLRARIHGLPESAAAAPPDGTIRKEARELLSVLRPLLIAPWKGRTAILEMRDRGSTEWRQMEWIGFYFEMVGASHAPAVVGRLIGADIRPDEPASAIAGSNSAKARHETMPPPSADDAPAGS